MKITIIRHGDPDYENNTLTPTGFKEAEALGKHFKKRDGAVIYSSPLPRAKLTALAISKDIIVKDWLQEFVYPVTMPVTNEKHLTWDFLPSFYLNKKEMYDIDKYLDMLLMKTGNIKEIYTEICKNFDDILKEHGYIRVDNYYKVEKESEDEIIFVCHFGMMCVLMSHLMNIPHSILGMTTCCAPTGVTRFVSEEREKGIAHFRCLCFSDTSHLALENYEPSFAGRFCEIYSSKDRH